MMTICNADMYDTGHTQCTHMRAGDIAIAMNYTNTVLKLYCGWCTKICITSVAKNTTSVLKPCSCLILSYISAVMLMYGLVLSGRESIFNLFN